MTEGFTGSMSRALLGTLAALAGVAMPQVVPAQDFLVKSGEAGRRGGSLVEAQRAAPKTLNPVTAQDTASRAVLRCMMADLVHINRETQRTEPALAAAWSVAQGGRRYVLRLRRGVRFSDGHPFDADDVLFTFRVYLDEKIHSPQRDLLIVGGRPIAVNKVDSWTVAFDLAKPYAAAERLFDSVAMLPRHLLEKAWADGKLAESWSLNAAPAQIAGLGPFRLKQIVPGERVVMERNPYYWKVDAKGTRLPYLDSLVFLLVAGEDAQVLRFRAGESDVADRLGARNYAALEARQRERGYRLYDLGPGLEYNFLFFNLNDLGGRNLPRVAARQAWFRERAFRQAISEAVDREAIVKLVYQGRATPLWGHVTPGNKLWVNTRMAPPVRSLEHARQLLRQAGFSWRDGMLVDGAGQKVEFSIAVSASSRECVQTATVLQEDLRQLGVVVHVASLEFRALLDRLFKSYDYEACVTGLGGGDADPNAEMNVWLSSGGTHLWNLGGAVPSTGWEAEIDRLMQAQLTTLDYTRRKGLYDRVQELAAANLPIICLVSPNVLVGAKNDVGNFRPALLDSHVLWNVEEIFRRR